MVTYGFYNSRDHDRLYDAIQMSSIFDGIIRDGIFMSIGTCLRVTADTGMTILVGIGRAWFNHTWTLNDAVLPLSVPQSELLLNRIDAVVLEVNAEVSVRQNTIKVIKGTPATNPVRPTMVQTDKVHQYPLAFINVAQRASAIRQADITNMVGTSSAPFVTGILDTINIDMLVAQWEDQWRKFFEDQTDDMEKTNAYWKRTWEQWYQASKDYWYNWRAQYEADMNATGRNWKNRWESWFYAYVNDNTNDISNWKEETNQAFKEWWDDLRIMLEDDVAAVMADEITKLKKSVDILEEFRRDLIEDHAVWVPLVDDQYPPIIDQLEDSNGGVVQDSDLGIVETVIGFDHTSEPFLDSNGETIDYRVIFCIR